MCVCARARAPLEQLQKFLNDIFITHTHTHTHTAHTHTQLQKFLNDIFIQFKYKTFTPGEQVTETGPTDRGRGRDRDRDRQTDM